MPYEPKPHILALAATVNGTPIADGTKADGTVVIVMEDGRKLTFPPQPAHSQPAPAQAPAGAKTSRRPSRKAKKAK